MIDEKPNGVSARFMLGRVLATPGALAALTTANETAEEFLSRHALGDWGCPSEEDRQANDQSLIDGTRLLSSYRLRTGTKVWIITEAADDQGCRVATTLLLPEEY